MIRHYTQDLDGTATPATWKRSSSTCRTMIQMPFCMYTETMAPGNPGELHSKTTRRFVVQDRLGVLGGVYPPDACATYFDETLSKGYMTALDGVHAILRCLSGGQSALKMPRESYIRTLYGPTGSYKEFLYE